MEDFNNGDDIIQLPCKHIFQPEAIKTWLKNESSKCPVCRYELKFEEVKIKSECEDEDEQEYEESQTDMSYNDTNDRAYNQMFNNMNFLYDPLSSIRRPRRPNLISQQRLVNRIMNLNNNYYEDTQLQNAIMASLQDSNNNENNVEEEEEEENEENEEEDEEEEEIFEAMMEEIMSSFNDDDDDF